MEGFGGDIDFGPLKRGGEAVVEDDLDFLVGVNGHHLRHEVVELHPAFAGIVTGLNLAGGDIHPTVFPVRRDSVEPMNLVPAKAPRSIVGSTDSRPTGDLSYNI